MLNRIVAFFTALFTCIVWDDGYVFTIIDRDNLKVLYSEYIQAVV